MRLKDPCHLYIRQLHEKHHPRLMDVYHDCGVHCGSISPASVRSPLPSYLSSTSKQSATPSNKHSEGGRRSKKKGHSRDSSRNFRPKGVGQHFHRDLPRLAAPENTCSCSNPDGSHAYSLSVILSDLYKNQIPPTLSEIQRRLEKLPSSCAVFREKFPRIVKSRLRPDTESGASALPRFDPKKAKLGREFQKLVGEAPELFLDCIASAELALACEPCLTDATDYDDSPTKKTLCSAKCVPTWDQSIANTLSALGPDFDEEGTKRSLQRMQQSAEIAMPCDFCDAIAKTSEKFPEASAAVAEDSWDRFVIHTSRPSRGSESYIFFAQPPPDFMGFVDPNDPEPPFSPETVAAASLYLMELTRLGAPSFRAGRFLMAQQMKSRGPLHLQRFSLGQLCHLVQTLLTQNFISYDNHLIRPIVSCEALTKASSARKLKLVDEKKGSEVRTIRTNIRRLLIQYPEGIVLSQLRKTYEASFGIPLQFDSLGYTKLAVFFREELQDLCTVVPTVPFNCLVVPIEKGEGSGYAQHISTHQGKISDGRGSAESLSAMSTAATSRADSVSALASGISKHESQNDDDNSTAASEEFSPPLPPVTGITAPATPQKHYTDLFLEILDKYRATHLVSFHFWKDRSHLNWPTEDPQSPTQPALVRADAFDQPSYRPVSTESKGDKALGASTRASAMPAAYINHQMTPNYYNGQPDNGLTTNAPPLSNNAHYYVPAAVQTPFSSNCCGDIALPPWRLGTWRHRCTSPTPFTPLPTSIFPTHPSTKI